MCTVNLRPFEETLYNVQPHQHSLSPHNYTTKENSRTFNIIQQQRLHTMITSTHPTTNDPTGTKKATRKIPTHRKQTNVAFKRRPLTGLEARQRQKRNKTGQGQNAMTSRGVHSSAPNRIAYGPVQCATHIANAIHAVCVGRAER